MKRVPKPVIGILGFLLLVGAPIIAGEGFQLLSPVVASLLELVTAPLFGVLMLKLGSERTKVGLNKETATWAGVGLVAGIVMIILAYVFG